MYVSQWLFHDRCYRVKKNKEKIYVYFFIYIKKVCCIFCSISIQRKEKFEDTTEVIKAVNLGRSDNAIVQNRRKYK